MQNKGYRGVNNLKGPNVPVNWTAEMVSEMQKCSDDPFYFIEKYITIVSPDNGLITIKLYDYQREIIESIHTRKYTVAECARQSGKTTSLAAYVVWYILFNDYKTVAILADKERTAMEIMNRVQESYENLPTWMQRGLVSWNKGSFQLENKSRVLVAATTPKSFRGFSINLAIVDEAAHVEHWKEFFAAVHPTISAGKKSKLVLISTVKGLNHFYNITKGAREGTNTYRLISVPWQRVEGRDQKWKEETLAAMDYDYELFAQEYENEYLGSSGTLISGVHLKRLSSEMAMHSNDGMRQYEQPQKGHIYALIADPSYGKGLDDAAVQVIDITEIPYRQVLTYSNNTITPADFASMINYIGKLYNEASTLVEVNSIGNQVAESLYFDFEYGNMLFTEGAGSQGKRVTTLYKNNVSTHRGVMTSKPIKKMGCSLIKLLIEQDKLILKDKQTIDQLKTFSKKRDSYEAEEGKKDDLVMCLVLFGWLSEQRYFKDLTEHNTIMELRDKEEHEMEEDLLPFGFLVSEDAHIIEKDNADGEYWEVVKDYGSW